MGSKLAFSHLLQTSERTRDLQNHIGCADVAKQRITHKRWNLPNYSDIWQKYGDLNYDEDLVNFFYEVLENRSKLEFLKMNEDEAPPPAVGDANTAIIANLSFPRQASLAVIHLYRHRHPSFYLGLCPKLWVGGGQKS